MLWLIVTLAAVISSATVSDPVPMVGGRYDFIGSLEMNLDTPLREVPSNFLSVGLEPWLIRNDWENFNTSSPVLQTMVGALAPGILRMGGTSANFLTYDPDTAFGSHLQDDEFDNDYGLKDFSNFTMTGQDLGKLLDFVEVVNMTLLWDVNQFYREADGDWEPTNARLIMKEVKKRNQNVVWQLGNEPNIYDHHNNFSITGQQDALDYAIFREELEAVFGDVTVTGPDITDPKVIDSRSDSIGFLKEFLKFGAQELDIISWHQYYGGGSTVVIDDFLDPDVMNKLANQIAQIVAVKEEMAPTLPIWLTETSSFYSGGAPGMSNGYVSGFIWLDKLGLASQMGIDLVVRESLYHGSYALLDPNLNPYPDYWLSVIYNQQVGGGVLEFELTTTRTTVRLYANCLSTSSQYYNKGGVVVYGMNVGDEGAAVNLGDDLADTEILEMLLQPPEGDLLAGSVMF